MEKIKQTFAKCKQEKRAALVAYVTAGYPLAEESVDIMLGMETGGAGEFLLFFLLELYFFTFQFSAFGIRFVGIPLLSPPHTFWLLSLLLLHFVTFMRWE